jgi:hypothetical protein
MCRKKPAMSCGCKSIEGTEDPQVTAKKQSRESVPQAQRISLVCVGQGPPPSPKGCRQHTHPAVPGTKEIDEANRRKHPVVAFIKAQLVKLQRQTLPGTQAGSILALTVADAKAWREEIVCLTHDAVTSTDAGELLDETRG